MTSIEYLNNAVIGLSQAYVAIDKAMNELPHGTTQELDIIRDMIRARLEECRLGTNHMTFALSEITGVIKSLEYLNEQK